MKTILVLTGGGETDETVFETAFAAAAPFAAHLEFMHVRVSPGDAAPFTPHVDFARGPALRDAMDRLEAEAQARSVAAARRFRQFCEERAIEVTDTPRHGHAVSAIWREESDDPVERMMLRARHNDLVVVGRARRTNGLPSDPIELLLFGCGRPLLIAPHRASQRTGGTVLVCWKETAEAARALSAAMPLLSKGKRVVIAGVEEDAGSLSDNFEIARQLAWHGIAAEATWMPADSRSVAEQLEAAANRYDADLMVMGGYGHARARELLFGGCTQHFLEHADKPLFLMH
jgi:nucleotide-binding universal stress UspA family protein